MRAVLGRGAEVMLCGTCCRSRGLAPAQVVDAVRIGTIRDLVAGADEVVTF